MIVGMIVSKAIGKDILSYADILSYVLEVRGSTQAM